MSYLGSPECCCTSPESWCVNQPPYVLEKEAMRSLWWQAASQELQILIEERVPGPNLKKAGQSIHLLKRNKWVWRLVYPRAELWEHWQRSVMHMPRHFTTRSWSSESTRNNVWRPSFPSTISFISLKLPLASCTTPSKPWTWNSRCSAILHPSPVQSTTTDVMASSLKSSTQAAWKEKRQNSLHELLSTAMKLCCL